MPIYEYACTICSNVFEKLRPMSRMDEPASCPDLRQRLQAQALRIPVILHRRRRPRRPPSRAEAAAAVEARAQAAPAQPRGRQTIENANRMMTAASLSDDWHRIELRGWSYGLGGILRHSRDRRARDRVVPRPAQPVPHGPGNEPGRAGRDTLGLRPPLLRRLLPTDDRGDSRAWKTHPWGAQSVATGESAGLTQDALARAADFGAVSTGSRNVRE